MHVYRYFNSSSSWSAFPRVIEVRSVFVLLTLSPLLKIQNLSRDGLRHVGDRASLWSPVEGRPGISDVSPLSEVSGLSV